MSASWPGPPGGRLDVLPKGAPCRMGKIREIPRDEAAPFLLEWHYMTYVPNKTSLRFYGYSDETGIACIIALNHRPTNQHVARKHFGDDWKSLNIGELSRMACRDECPKRTESMFLSRILKLLRRLGYDAVISYADMAEQHEGTIYRATNWVYTGFVAPNEKYFVDGCITGKGVPYDAPHEPDCAWPKGNRVEVNWRQCRHKWNSSHGAGLLRILGDRIQIEPGKGKHRFVFPLTRRAEKMLRQEVIVT